MKTKIVWSSPKGYVFRKWLFDFGNYMPLTIWVRICGLLIQRYQDERVITHPITGSKHTAP